MFLNNGEFCHVQQIDQIVVSPMKHMIISLAIMVPPYREQFPNYRAYETLKALSVELPINS
jgi:hypothetical protein